MNDISVPRLKGGSVVKTLAKNFGKSVRVLEEAKDFREFTENLVAPTSICGINTLYTSEGEIHKIRLPQKSRSKIYVSHDSLSTIISSVYHTKLKFVFED